MWKIEKSFEFDYGHRVWTQNLMETFSCDTELKCRFLHGHRGVVKVSISSDTLDPAGMVTDFKHLNWFKKFIDDVIDHKTIMDISDPALPILFPLISKYPLQTFKEGYSVCTGFDSNLIQEIYGGIVIVNFTPTSEKLSQWLHQVVEEKMHDIDSSFKIEVTFQETPSSCSHYSKV